MWHLDAENNKNIVLVFASMRAFFYLIIYIRGTQGRPLAIMRQRDRIDLREKIASPKGDFALGALTASGLCSPSCEKGCGRGSAGDPLCCSGREPSPGR